MARVSVGVQIGYGLLDSIDKDLAGLGLVSRMPAIKKGLSAACGAVETRLQQILPKPGYPGDKPELTPLREATGSKVIEYPEGKVVGLVGFDYVAGGSHGHLVEEGHRMVVGGSSPIPTAGRRLARPSSSGERGKGKIVGFVEGRHYLELSAEWTEGQQQAAMAESIQEAIEESKRG